MKNFSVNLCFFFAGLFTNLRVVSTNPMTQEYLDATIALQKMLHPMSHLSCNCPEGSYVKGTWPIFTPIDICQQSPPDRHDGSEGPPMDTTISNDLEVSNVAKEGNGSNHLIRVPMKICDKCAAGCSLCLGPDENDCLKCLPGYLISYYQDIVAAKPDAKFDDMATQPANKLVQRSKRQVQTSGSFATTKTVESTGKSQVSSKIYEEDELIAIKSKTPTLSPSSSSKSTLKKGRPPDDDSTFYVDDNFMSSESSGYLYNTLDNDSPVPYHPPSTTTTNVSDHLSDQENHSPVKRNENYDEQDADNHVVEPDKKINGGVIIATGDDEGGGQSLSWKQTVPQEQHKSNEETESTTETKEHLTVTSTEATTSRKNVTESNYSDLEHSDKNAEPTVTTRRPAVQPSTTTTTTTSTTTTTATIIEWRRSSPFSCVAHCPDGFHASEDNICQACHPECDGCHANGPGSCIKCRHFQQHGQCVSTCHFENISYAVSNNLTEEWRNGSTVADCAAYEAYLLTLQHGDNANIPDIYYAVPPLVILAVVLFILLSYFRRHYRLQVNLPCTGKGPRMSRSNTLDHEEHKKCFLNRQRQMNQMADLKLSGEYPMKKRQGNAYVYAERALQQPPKSVSYGNQSPGHHHQQQQQKTSVWLSHSKDIDDDLYESDPLYETPDSTWGRDGAGRLAHGHQQQRRRSSATAHGYLVPTNTFKVSQLLSGDDSRRSKSEPPSRTKTPTSNGRNTPDSILLDTTTTDSPFSLATMEIVEPPYFDAPPLPSRNSPDTDHILNDDHIYVNIDEEL